VRARVLEIAAGLSLSIHAQGFEVGFVSCPPGRPLVPNQGFAADEVDLGYSTPLEFSDSMNWRQSSGSGIALLVRHGPKLEQNLQPFRWRKSLLIGARGRFSLAKSSKLGDRRLHGPILSPQALLRNSRNRRQNAECRGWEDGLRLQVVHALVFVATARAFRLSSYNAVYLDVARRERSPLATLDEELRAAARQAGVALLRAAERR
jgi:predicted nucleic acid-binding protein